MISLLNNIFVLHVHNIRTPISKSSHMIQHVASCTLAIVCMEYRADKTSRDVGWGTYSRLRKPVWLSVLVSGTALAAPHLCLWYKMAAQAAHELWRALRDGLWCTFWLALVHWVGCMSTLTYTCADTVVYWHWVLRCTLCNYDLTVNHLISHDVILYRQCSWRTTVIPWYHI